MSAMTGEASLRLRLATSRRLRGLQAGFICAAGCAAWLVVAPRLGVLPAAAAVLVAVAWLAWRAGIACAQRPCAVVLQAAGGIALVDGTRPVRERQLAGLVQWPGLLALEWVPEAGSQAALLVLSDELERGQFRALAAWSRRHQRRGSGF